ncbi:MAG: A/G-specific adenine glycosylase [Nitrospirae bacterium]|nr:A/G-specific adenine glycosylase [Nitrospirota bacterium]
MTVSAPLLAWYDRARRDLPWRRTADPYAIWVSEAMLQQTQVATVIPYYHRFLQRFPTVQALAAAPEGDVLKAWEGLGYYSRARNLQKAARVVLADHGGRLPDTAAALKTLPGIGPYMAGAVASIAFGRSEPVLDGNVERVLTRLFAIADPVAGRATRQHLWALAAELLSPARPGDHNQAMMELGATLCTPRAPACGACPLSARCRAAAAGNPEGFPCKTPRAATPHHHIAVGVVAHGGRLLLVRRPPKGLLGGMWEFPGGRVADGEAVADGVARNLRERFGLTVAVATPLAPVRHAFTHRRVTLHPFHCRAAADAVAPRFHVDHRWLAGDAVAGLALPRAHQKIAAQMAGQPSGPVTGQLFGQTLEAAGG